MTQKHSCQSNSESALDPHRPKLSLTLTKALLLLGFALGLGTHGALMAAPLVTIVINVAGSVSHDDVGSPLNSARTVNAPKYSTLVGMEWDLQIETLDPSWISEAALTISTSDGTHLVTLVPGIGDDSSGAGSYAGSVDLEALGLQFAVQPEDFLRLEFWETFDDFPGDPDAHWTDGTVTLFLRATSEVIPEPSTLSLMLLSVLALARSRKLKTH